MTNHDMYNHDIDKRPALEASSFRRGHSPFPRRLEVQVKVETQKRFRMPEMEGAMARWYARQRGSATQMKVYRKQAALLTEGLPSGARVLEVAPGPGYQAIEMARRGRFQVTGLDISRTMVEIASGKAREAALSIDFRQGDATSLPFEAGSFDLVVCQAAFKNFRQPVKALDEMHRVLRDGGVAVIQDLSRDASDAEIEREVSEMELGGLNAFVTKFVLGGML